MAKKVNIEDKLQFEENPVLVLGEMEIEINSDAETVLRVIGAFSEENQMKAIGKALNIMFKPEDLEKICKIEKNGRKLSAKALMEIVQEALSLVTGETKGEQ